MKMCPTKWHGVLPRDARGQIRGDTTGRLKLVFHRDTRKVLGVHIIGEGASELVHIGQAVMILGGTVDYFIDTVSTIRPSPSATRQQRSTASAGFTVTSRSSCNDHRHRVVITEHIVAGRLQDQRSPATPSAFPRMLASMMPWLHCPRASFASCWPTNRTLFKREPDPVDAIGIAVPGIVRHGVVEDSPNLTQLKGMRLAEEVTRALAARGITAPVHISTMPTRSRRAWLRRAASSTSLRVCGPSATASATAAGPTLKASGRAVIRSSLSTRRKILRLRWGRASGRHHGLSRHADALSRPRTRRSVRAGQAGRSALPRVCRAMASGARCRNSLIHPPRRPGAFTLPGTTSGSSN